MSSKGGKNKRKAEVLSEVETPNTPTKSSTQRAIKSSGNISANPDQLSCFSLDSRVLSKAVKDWLSGSAPGTGKNSALPGRLDVVSEGHLKFSVPDLETLGLCWSYSTRTQSPKSSAIEVEVKLLEGGGNHDSPRWQHDKKKHYIYHIMALYAAQCSEAAVMTEAIGAKGSKTLSLPIDLKYSVDDLARVSASKSKKGVLTILHLCGNKWCCFPGHYFVGSKIYNDEQTACHKGLHNALSLEEYLQIQACYCKHEPKCWALPYAGIYNLTPGFCKTGLDVGLDSLVEEGKTGSSSEYGSGFEMDDLWNRGE